MTVSQGMLGEFIEFIQEQKVVEMDELAVHFEMRTQDAIKRIEDLLMMGRIHGVIDDRGKFICVTEDELKAVTQLTKASTLLSLTSFILSQTGGKIHEASRQGECDRPGCRV